MQRNRPEPERCARCSLGQGIQASGRNGSELWIATDGLAVIEQHDGLPVSRNLDGAQAGAFRYQAFSQRFQCRAFQARAHAVGLPGQGVGIVEEGFENGRRKAVDLGTRNHGKHQLFLIVRPPALRDFSVQNPGATRVAGQVVAFLQWATILIQASEPLSRKRGTAVTQPRRYLKPAKHCQIASYPNLRCTEGNSVAGLNIDNAPERPGLSVNPALYFCSGNRDLGSKVTGELNPAEGDFQRGRAEGIIQQPVSPGPGIAVHGATSRQPQVHNTPAPAILQQTEKAGFCESQAWLGAHSWPPSARYSSRPMGRKRTRWPACSREGWPRPGSNSVRGVRPIRFQPPGDCSG